MLSKTIVLTSKTLRATVRDIGASDGFFSRYKDKKLRIVRATANDLNSSEKRGSFRLLIAITIYNESFEDLSMTLYGIQENIIKFESKGKSRK